MWLRIFILFALLTKVATADNPARAQPSPAARSTAAYPPAPVVQGEKFIVPDPDGASGVIVDFANAIDGTDGTPSGIGNKISKRNEKEQRREPVLGF